MTIDQLFLVLSDAWEFLLYIIVLTVLFISHPFKGKNWLTLATVSWLMTSLLVLCLDVDELIHTSLTEILPEYFHDLIWANYSLASAFLLPMFLLVIWSNKYLNINSDSLLFSFKGRVPRSLYLMISFFNIGLCAYALSQLFNELDAGNYDGISMNQIYWGSILLLQTWFSLVISIKRWHDHDKSAWFILIYFIPIVGSLINFFVLGFLRGTDGSNRFGDDPLKSKKRTQ